MTQEQIQTAAEAYAASIAQSEDRKRYCAEDFIAGAKWCIESVWHDASEVPPRRKYVLTDGKDGPMICGTYDLGWEYTVKTFGITVWADPQDLVPPSKQKMR